MSQSKSCIVILEIESSIYFFNNIIGEEKKGKKNTKISMCMKYLEKQVAVLVN